MLAHARWRAEREFPAQWGGAKVNINVTSKIEMGEALNTVAGELLDQIASKLVLKAPVFGLLEVIGFIKGNKKNLSHNYPWLHSRA